MYSTGTPRAFTLTCHRAASAVRVQTSPGHLSPPHPGRYNHARIQVSTTAPNRVSTTMRNQVSTTALNQVSTTTHNQVSTISHNQASATARYQFGTFAHKQVSATRSIQPLATRSVQALPTRAVQSPTTRSVRFRFLSVGAAAHPRCHLSPGICQVSLVSCPAVTRRPSSVGCCHLFLPPGAPPGLTTV